MFLEYFVKKICCQIWTIFLLYQVDQYIFPAKYSKIIFLRKWNDFLSWMKSSSFLHGSFLEHDVYDFSIFPKTLAMVQLSNIFQVFGPFKQHLVKYLFTLFLLFVPKNPTPKTQALFKNLPIIILYIITYIFNLVS